jgi:uncharacterized protein YjeT (DUF2065 family)
LQITVRERLQVAEADSVVVVQEVDMLIKDSPTAPQVDSVAMATALVAVVEGVGMYHKTPNMVSRIFNLGEAIGMVKVSNLVVAVDVVMVQHKGSEFR